MQHLRETFETAAASYHRARPGYPEELFDDLLRLTGLGPGAAALEIGPGTGIATLPLAARGLTIHAIELGAALANEARKNLAGYPQVTVEIGAFETAALESQAYDLVYSATAFHWIKQPVGYAQVNKALKPGGYFAEFRYHHIRSSPRDEFSERSQEVYLRWHPDTRPDFQLPAAEDVPTLEQDIIESGYFEPPVVLRYILEVEHTPDSFRALLMTFSDHIALPEPNRTNLIDGIADIIRSFPGQRIVKTYLILLHLARKKGGA